MIVSEQSEEAKNCNLASGTALERPAKEGESPVGESHCMLLAVILEYCPARRLGRKQGGLDTQG